MPDMLTVPDIAKRLGIPTHRVRYAIDQYKIEPDARVVNVRVWKEERFEEIKRAVQRIASSGPSR